MHSYSAWEKRVRCTASTYVETRHLGGVPYVTSSGHQASSVLTLVRIDRCCMFQPGVALRDRAVASRGLCPRTDILVPLTQPLSASALVKKNRQ